MTLFESITIGSDRLATSIDLPPAMAPESRDTGHRCPVVVVVHGLTGQRMGKSYHLVEFGRRLAAEGIACVRFDQRGCGESTGMFRDVTLPRMTEDTAVIRAWLIEQSWADTTRLGYMGLSLGALPVVAADAAHGARGIALWAPVYDMPRVFGLTAKSGLRGILEGQGWVPYRGLQIGKGFVDSLDAIDTAARLAEGTCPLLVFHSKSDAIVPFAESQAYVERCRALNRLCELIPFANADHDFADYHDRQRVLGATIAFFRKQLFEED